MKRVTLGRHPTLDEVSAYYSRDAWGSRPGAPRLPFYPSLADVFTLL